MIIYLENNFSTQHNQKPNQIEVQFKHLCQIHPVFDFDNKTVDYHFEIPYVEPIPDVKIALSFIMETLKSPIIPGVISTLLNYLG